MKFIELKLSAAMSASLLISVLGLPTFAQDAENVAGSSAKVLLPWLRVTGSCFNPCASAVCSEPIARKVVFWFSIRSLSASLRAAIFAGSGFSRSRIASMSAVVRGGAI